MSVDENSDIQDELKNITIRGVDLDAYNAFTNKLKEFNMNVGDAFNKMIEDVMDDFEEVFSNESPSIPLKYKKRLPRLSISNHDELKVSADDITQTKSVIAFSHIDLLEFDESVTKEVFLNYIRHIANCTTVVFPKSFPKLIALSHCDHCDEIKFKSE